MTILNPKTHWSASRELLGLLTRHRHLTWEMTKREVTDVYAGRVLGALWVIGHPLVQMGVYLFIFSVVFKARAPHSAGFPGDYVIYLLSGLIPWMSFLTAMNKASLTLVSNSALVKQVVFPIEVLPVRGVLAALLPQLVSLALLMIYCLARFGTLPWTWVLLPALVVLQFIAMAGVCLMLSAVGAFFRDVGELVQVFGVVGIFLMPAFYHPDMVPELFRPLLYLNPFSYLIWCYQDLCYFGEFGHPWAWPTFVALALLSFGLGYRVFRQLKPYFGNVL
ncbi:MAG: ABC transporter permease [Chloroflexi bacterium]|nr:ABC transporter permease [Chloroflexota bacterium]